MTQGRRARSRHDLRQFDDLVHALDAILHRDLKDWMLYPQSPLFPHLQLLMVITHARVSKFGVFSAFELALLVEANCPARRPHQTRGCSATVARALACQAAQGA